MERGLSLGLDCLQRDIFDSSARRGLMRAHAICLQHALRADDISRNPAQSRVDGCCTERGTACSHINSYISVA